MSSALELNLKYESIPLSKRLAMSGTTTMTKNMKINDDEWGDKIDMVDTVTGYTPLMVASIHGTIETVKVLISRGANMNLREAVHGKSAILFASKNGHLEVVDELLHRGALINIVDNRGMTALMYACREGHFSIMLSLLKYGVGINLVDENGWSAVHFASKNGHKDIVYYLAKSGAILGNKEYLDGKTPLMLASQYGRPESAAVLIQHEAQVNARSTKEGLTALMLAAKEGHKGIVSLLLQSGAEVNSLDIFAWTALHYAASWGRRETATLLIDGRAELDLMGYTHEKVGGTTALIIATKASHIDVMKVLLTRGANPDLNDWKERKSALMYASELGLATSVSCLLEHSAAVNLREGHTGLTPLMFAAKNGHEEVMSILLGKYADLNIIDIFGKTAYDHAVESGYRDAFVRAIVHSSADSKANITPWVEMMLPKMKRGYHSDGPSVFLNSILYDGNNGLYCGLYHRDPSLDVYLLFSLIMIWVACKQSESKHPLDAADLADKMIEVDDMIATCLQSKAFSNDRIFLASLLLNPKLVDEEQELDIRSMAGAFVSGPLALSIEHGITTFLIFPKYMALLDKLMWTCLLDPGIVINGFGNRSILMRLRYCPAAMFIWEGLCRVLLLILVLVVASPGSVSSIQTLSGFSSSEACLAFFMFCHLFYELGQIEEKRWTPPSSIIFDLKELEQFRLSRAATHFFEDSFKFFDLSTLVLLFAWFFMKLSDTSPSEDSSSPTIGVGLAAIPLCLGLLRYPSFFFPNFGNFVVFLFTVSLSLWRFVVVFAATGLGFGIAFHGIYSKEIDGLSDITSTFSYLVDSTFTNFDMNIFDNTAEIVLGKSMLMTFVCWTSVVLLSAIVAHIVVVYSQLKEVATRRWALFKSRQIQTHILVFERSALSMLPPPFNIFPVLTYIAHVFYIWRARLFWRRQFAISFGGQVSDMFVAIFFWIPATFVEYFSFISKGNDDSCYMIMKAFLSPLGLFACLMSLGTKILTKPRTQLIIKSRVTDGRLRMRYSADRDYNECVGYKDELMVTLKNLEDLNNPPKQVDPDSDKPIAILSRRTVADLGVSNSFRLNTSIGKDVRIAPQVSLWDATTLQQNTKNKSNDFKDIDKFTMSSEAPIPSSNDPRITSKYIALDASESKSIADDISMDASQFENTNNNNNNNKPNTSIEERPPPKKTIRFAKPADQFSFLFPPAKEVKIFDKWEKRSIFRNVLQECMSTEAKDLMDMTQANLAAFKQSVSDRITEMEKRQDMMVDMIVKALDKLDQISTNANTSTKK